MAKIFPIIQKNIKTENIYKPESVSKFLLKFDGCSKGNTGLSGAGAVIYHDDDEIWSGYKFVSLNATNNYAEYSGLILGLENVIKMNIKSIIVEGDSMLVINQMLGKYTCNSQNLLELYNKAKELENKLDHIDYKHILRNENKVADKLSNIAVENYLLYMNNNKI